MKILIVDDSRAMRNMVKRTLRQAGYTNHTIEEAGDGQEAFDTIQTFKPDLVLCDWNMPVLNGIELLQKLNKEEIFLNFGFVTTESRPDQCRLAIKAGALFIIKKPFTPEDFQKHLDFVLK
ncbi:MAG: response regulator [Deltaproteobacteria bacterium]|nr:response regulator [Deltaproteobacteria bacterium]